MSSPSMPSEGQWAPAALTGCRRSCSGGRFQAKAAGSYSFCEEQRRWWIHPLTRRARREAPESWRAAATRAASQKFSSMLPTSRRVRKIMRQAIDDPTTVPHAMLTQGADSSVRAWCYVLGSATRGARWYVLRDGTRKRLTARHHHRSRKKGKHDGDGGCERSDAIDVAGVARDPDAELRASLRITRSTYPKDVTDEEELYGDASASGAGTVVGQS